MDELKAHRALVSQALEYLDMLSALSEKMAKLCEASRTTTDA